MTDKEIRQEFKQIRDLIFQTNQRISQYNDTLHEKENANMEYLAMMTDVDIDDTEEEE
jgi:hypothetical protein